MATKEKIDETRSECMGSMSEKVVGHTSKGLPIYSTSIPVGNNLFANLKHVKMEYI